MNKYALCLMIAFAACKKGGDTGAQPSAPSVEELSPAKATEKAPATFKVKFVTTKGDFVMEAHRDWAPNGVDRFYNLVKMGYYQNVGFFRVIDGFMVQFGIHGNPKVNEMWRTATIEDDPMVPGQSNKRGYVTFAKGGPNTRTVQMFINFVDNARLDGMGFPPFAQVVSGMEVVDQLFKVGEGKPAGPGPAQGRLQMEGNAYLQAEYPKLDYVKYATLEK